MPGGALVGVLSHMGPVKNMGDVLSPDQLYADDAGLAPVYADDALVAPVVTKD